MEIPGQRHVVRLLWGMMGALMLLALPCSAQTYLYSRATFATGNTPVAAVAMDFNGDGQLDLAVVNQADNTVSVLLGKPDASFAPKVDYPVGESPVAIVAADFNGDGKLDLAVVNSGSNTVSVLLGNGDGTFAAHVDYSTDGLPIGVVAADFNGDGKVDLAVVTGYSTVSILLGNGNGTFAAQTSVAVGINPVGLAAGDFNGDGKIDLITSNNTPEDLLPLLPSVTVLLSKGDGTFTRVDTSMTAAATGALGALAVGDFNHDGKLDAVVVIQGGAIVFLQGQGDGTFKVSYPASIDPDDTNFSATTLVAADFNRDGKLDLVAAGDRDAALLLGVGNGTFQPGPYLGGLYGLALLSAEINGDGVPDLVFGESSNEVRVLLGGGDGTFGTTPNYNLFSLSPLGTIGSGPAIAADFTGDGKTDVAVEESSMGTALMAVALGKGDGSFQAPVSTALPAGGAGPLVAGDFNGDGKMDFAAWTLSSYQTENSVPVLSIFLSNGDGTFQPPLDVLTPTFPVEQSLAVGDFNGDGKPDLVIVISNSSEVQDIVQILLGQGNGTFVAGPSFTLAENFEGAGNLVTGDFNHDGKIDLAIGNRGQLVAVFLGNGDGTFHSPVYYDCGHLYITAIAAADFNGDGNLDLVVSTDVGVSVFLGNGDGTFQSHLDTNIAGGAGGQLAIEDFNGDGKLDLAFGYIVLIGNGDGTFQTPPHDLGVAPSGVAVGDFNSDGTYDLAFDIQYIGVIPFLTFMLSGPQIALSPATLNFGPQEVGVSGAVQDVTVTNIGNAPMTIASIVAGGDYSQTNTCGAAIPIEASCVVSVTFTPTAVGVLAGMITLHDNLKTSPQVIALSGAGVAPTVSLLPASVTFGVQSMGATSPPKMVTLTNTGNVPLIVSSIAVDGDFAQTNNCGKGVAAGSNCTISVTFTPTADGTRSGQLTVTDNALDSPQSVALTGSGPDFALAPPSGSPTTASVPPGQSGTFTLSVVGEGGLNQTVTFACTGAPSEATCTVSPNPATAGSSATNITVTVTTTAPSAGAPRGRHVPRSRPYRRDCVV